MKGTIMKQLNLILSLIIIMVSVILCHQIIANSISNQKNKIDYTELNHIRYGLLSVEEWKRQISVILYEEINKLYLSKTNERVLRKHIEVMLNTLIDNVDKKIREGNSVFIPGIIAFAVDFSNGTIYLPGTARSALDLKDMKQVKFNSKHYNNATIEKIIKKETEYVVKLNQDNMKITRLDSIDGMKMRFAGVLPEINNKCIVSSMN